MPENHDAPRGARRRMPHLGRVLLTVTALGTTVGLGIEASQRGLVAPAAAQAIKPQGPSERLPDFSGLVKQVKPAVVSITSIIHDAGGDDDDQGGGGEGGGGGGQQMPFPFPFPFGMAPQQQQHRTMEAKGSGFIIDANGTIVTNNHVVKGASSVSVTLDDGTVLPAKVVGRDPRTDIAVLRVKATGKLPFIELGDSDTVEPGQWVVAVGNPFGLGGTVTAGIVSARGRDIGEGNYDSFIQIDAPINRGNSGGPLFTQDGKVVGVNTAILSPSGGSIGIGFAIPSDLVRSIVDQLEKTGHVTRGYLGVEAQAISPAIARALNLPTAGSADDRGALIASIPEGSPASKSGLKPGDVITAVNGKHVGNPRELAIDISAITPGSSVQLTYLRNGKSDQVTVTIAKLGSTDTASAAQAGPSFGLALAPLDADTRQQLGLDEGVHGALVKTVTPGSQADQAGLQPGDVIVSIGNQPVASPNQASGALHKAIQANQTIAMRIVRQGQMLFVAVTPPSAGGDNGDQSGGDQGDTNGG